MPCLWVVIVTLLSSLQWILPQTMAQNISPGVIQSNVPWKAGHAAVFQDPYVIIYGGTGDADSNNTNVQGTRSVWVWNSQNGTWYDAQALSDNTGFSTQVFFQAVALPSTGQSLALASNITGGGALLQKLDSNVWSWNAPTSTNPPSPASGYTMTLINNTIYTYGGVSVDANGNRMSGAVLNSLSFLDANSFLWSSGSNGPAVTDHSTCYIPSCNCLVTFGGTQTGNTAQTSRSVYTYDLATRSWNLQINPASVNGAIPGPRRLHTATCLQDRMIVYGGGTTGPSDSDVWILDASKYPTLTWLRQEVANASLGPGVRMGHSAVLDATRKKVYIYGGWTGTSNNDRNMYILDIDKYSWSSVSPTGIPPVSSTSPSPTNSSTSSADSVPVGAIAGGVVGGVVALAAIALAAFFFMRRRKRQQQRQEELEKAAMEKDMDDHSQDDYYWRYGEGVTSGQHHNRYEDDYRTYSLSDPAHSDANLMSPYSHKRVSKAWTNKTGTASTRDSYRRSDNGDIQSSVMEMISSPSESHHDIAGYYLRGSRNSLPASKILLANDFDGPGQIPNEYLVQKPNEFSLPATHFAAQSNSSVPFDHYSSATNPSTATTDGAPLSSSMEVLRSVKTNGSGTLGSRNIKVTHAYARNGSDDEEGDDNHRKVKYAHSSKNGDNDSNNKISRSELVKSGTDGIQESDNEDDSISSREDNNTTPPIQYIPGASKQFSIATSITNSTPSQTQSNIAVPLTHHQYPSSSVPVARPVSPQALHNEPAGNRVSIHSFRPVSNHHHHGSDGIYDSVSPLDRLATLGQASGILHEERTADYFPSNENKTMTPPNTTTNTVSLPSPVVTPTPTPPVPQLNQSPIDVSRSSSTLTSTMNDTSGSTMSSRDRSNGDDRSNDSSSNNRTNNNSSNSNNNNSNNNDSANNNGHRQKPKRSSNQMTQNSQHLSVAGMLPRRYRVDKSIPPVVGPVNSILFISRTDDADAPNVVVKSFGRREAWERECRTLIKLKSRHVVTLLEVLTIQDESHPSSSSLSLPSPMITPESLDATSLSLSRQHDGDDDDVKYVTVMERLDEPLSTAIRRARPNSTEPLKPASTWSEQRTASIARDIVECLIWCHEKGVAFCDLKPSNIMHNMGEPWKLIDFEASRTIGEECVGVITPRYCPPEVARATTYGLEGANGVVATASVDLWALGCVLYELETKRPLFASSIKDETILHFVSHPSSSTPILNNGLRWNDQKELEIPQLERQIRNAHVRQLIKTLLSRDPAKRGTASQLLSHPYFNES